jgi:hypothetical protein
MIVINVTQQRNNEAKKKKQRRKKIDCMHSEYMKSLQEMHISSFYIKKLQEFLRSKIRKVCNQNVLYMLMYFINLEVIIMPLLKFR